MKLTDAELDTLIGKINRNDSSLEEVNLTRQNLSTQRLQQIAAALEQNYHLKILILDQNDIDDTAAQALGKALGVNSILTHFSAHMCSISDIGAASIARGMVDNSSLHKLELPGNKIRKNGAIALAKALAPNKTLREFNLGNCVIGADGLKQLGLMLDVNNHLQTLILDNNSLEPKAMREFEHHVANHPSLGFLDLWGNSLAYIFDESKYDVTLQSTKFIEANPLPCLAFLWDSKQQKTGADLDTHPIIPGHAKIRVRY